MPQKKLEYGLSSMRSLLCSYKRNAKRRGFTYNLTEEQFKEITQQDCYYCGIEPKQITDYNKRNGQYVYNGIDRIDNTKGYVIDNVVPCCGMCNRIKGKLSSVEFLDWLDRVIGKREARVF